MALWRIVLLGLVLTGTWLLAHVYVGSRVLQPGLWPQALDWAGWSLLAISWMLTPMAFLARFVLARKRAKPFQVAGFTGMGLFSVLIVLVVMTDLVLLGGEFVGQDWESRWLWRGVLGTWVVLCVAGGLCYTIGTVFLIFDTKVRYFHALWHLFVITGSCCHFLVIVNYVIPLQS